MPYFLCHNTALRRTPNFSFIVINECVWLIGNFLRFLDMHPGTLVQYSHCFLPEISRAGRHLEVGQPDGNIEPQGLQVPLYERCYCAFTSTRIARYPDLYFVTHRVLPQSLRDAHVVLALAPRVYRNQVSPNPFGFCNTQWLSQLFLHAISRICTLLR